MDIEIPTGKAFNKYQGLKWGEALPTTQNSGTYGLAGGLSSHFMGLGPGDARRRSEQEELDKDARLAYDLQDFPEAEKEGRVMTKQTLGGQIIKHDGVGDEAGKPIYFVGAFKGKELHLSQVSGTVQMRPQFHHLDAEDTKERINSRDQADASMESRRPEPRPRMVHQSYKSGPLGGSGNPKGELEEQSANLRLALQTAAEEQWVPLVYVDEEDDRAYEVYNKRMFNAEVGTERCRPLKAGMEMETWLDSMSATGKNGAVKRRRKGKDGEEIEDG